MGPDRTCGLPGSTPRRPLSGRPNSRRTTPDRTTSGQPIRCVCRPPRNCPACSTGQFLFIADHGRGRTEAAPVSSRHLRATYRCSAGSTGRWQSASRAVEELAVAEPLVPKPYQRTFAAESSPLRWFYHTARTQANFYESCQLRDALHAFAQRREQAETHQDDAGLASVESCLTVAHGVAGRKGEYARGPASCRSGYATRLLLRNRPCLPARDRHDPSEVGSPQS